MPLPLGHFLFGLPHTYFTQSVVCDEHFPQEQTPSWKPDSFQLVQIIDNETPKQMGSPGDSEYFPIDIIFGSEQTRS